MSTPIEAIVDGHERDMCGLCFHSFLWHLDDDDDVSHGCTVAGCECTASPHHPVAPTPSLMRRFKLVRDEDLSGISGVGQVAEGVRFTDGTCAMRWTTHTCSTCLYATYDDLLTIHGHEGRTRIEWIDEGG